MTIDYDADDPEFLAVYLRVSAIKRELSVEYKSWEEFLSDVSGNWQFCFVWCASLCLACESLSGVRAFVWCASLCLACEPLSGVRAFVWCASLCLECEPLSGVRAIYWRDSHYQV